MPISTTARAPHSPQAGFSLIEVLVTVLVLGAGLTGWALLLAAGLAYQHDAQSRTQATALANELIERIRATGIASTDPAAEIYQRKITATELGTCHARGAASPDNDRICWHTELRRRLPHSAGRISTRNNAYVIELFWFDGNARRDPNVSSRKQCETTGTDARIWSDNPIVPWVPASRAPSPPICLQAQRWVLPL